MSESVAIHHEHRDDEASKLGMWLFLFTELLLFGGLFLVYSIYRFMNPEFFAKGGYELDVLIGTVNTVVLLTSSLTVALSITAVQKGHYKFAMGLIWVTIVFALVFLVNKYFEWGHKFHLGLQPGGPTFNELPKAEALFFLLYFFMTGLHGLHIIAGSVLLAIAAVKIKKAKIQNDNFVFLENAGLYWHLVDIIWIFLFPLFYLIH
jgi:cytochrome c oxidase subunit 3